MRLEYRLQPEPLGVCKEFTFFLTYAGFLQEKKRMLSLGGKESKSPSLNTRHDGGCLYRQVMIIKVP
jgi:hypothetical protein